MSKDYKEMAQEELENEMVEVIKRNYDKGILLLDHNFSIRTIKKITEMSDVVNIDALIRYMLHGTHNADKSINIHHV